MENYKGFIKKISCVLTAVLLISIVSAPIIGIKDVKAQEKKVLTMKDLNFQDDSIDSDTLKLVAEQLEMQGALDYFDKIKEMIKKKDNKSEVLSVKDSSGNMVSKAASSYTLTYGGYVFFRDYYGSMYVSSNSSIYFTKAQTKNLLDQIKDPDIEPLEVFLAIFGLAVPYCKIPALVTAFFQGNAMYSAASLLNKYLQQEHRKALEGKPSEQLSIVEAGGRKIVVWIPWNTYPNVNINGGARDLSVTHKAPF